MKKSLSRQKNHLAGDFYADNTFLPFALLRARTLRPPTVAIRARKPWTLLCLILLGWYVLFMSCLLYFSNYLIINKRFAFVNKKVPSLVFLFFLTSIWLLLRHYVTIFDKENIMKIKKILSIPRSLYYNMRILGRGGKMSHSLFPLFYWYKLKCNRYQFM